MIRQLILLIFVFCVTHQVHQGVAKASASTPPSVHGLALGAAPKFGPDLNFPWVKPKTPQGGRFTIGAMATFDSMNPFALKNQADGLMYDIAGNGLVFETLTMRSIDEPFASYGTIAQSIDLDPSGLAMTYHLNPAAHWSDGLPLTADDVAFSFKILTSESALPSFKLYYADVKPPTVINASTVKFEFKEMNRELAMIVGEMPILPKHVYGKAGANFIKDFVTTKPIGSGPYVVDSFEFGKFIQFKRQLKYWGDGQPFSKSSWNYDTIVVKSYKDENALMEGFKAGDYDIKLENSARAWVVDHAGDKWNKKWIKKEFWTHNHNQGAQGFVFNLRRPLFQDIRVRKALAIAFDFDWANGSLFYNQYKVSTSFFNNSEFNATGLPDAKELALLAPLKDKLPPEVFTERKEALGHGLTEKQRLGAALKLLNAAGWALKNGVQTNAKGEEFKFIFLLNSPLMSRVVEPYLASLDKIGVKATVKIEDQGNYIKRLETWNFDMISDIFPESESPGNEQREFWHSDAATKPDSRNSVGLKDPAIDQLVEHLITVKSREELVVATKALDRALWFNYIAVPNWYLNAFRISMWNKFGIPENRPNHFQPLEFILRYGWVDPDLDAKLKAAVLENKSL